MNMRESLDGLQLVRRVSSQVTTGQQTKSGRAGGGIALTNRQASFAGSGMMLTAVDSGVRMDKVSAVRSALSEGRYNVPAFKVASRVTDSMFSERS